MELLATVEAILKQSPGEAVCAECLAFACEVTFPTMCEVIGRLVVSDESVVEASVKCASCRRSVTSFMYRPRAGKCAHCSEPVRREDLSNFIGGDLFHTACWRRLVSDETIRTSRALSRQSRDLIRQSRRRIREGHGWQPLDPSG